MNLRAGQPSKPTGKKAAPKLKLKLGDKSGQTSGMSFLGAYDRELDSDDEDLAFEEQFILRLPEGEDCDRLRKMVQARDIKDDVWFKFKDSRRAVFHIGNSTYTSKLVDLPCIIEAQKTLDNRQMYKVADICQMLVVEDKIESEDVLSHNKAFHVDDFIWPHGLTPPLKHVRKRRFRKRVNRTTIETVEQEVERLIEEDNAAAEVKYEVLENVNPDLSDSEFDLDHFDMPTPDAGGEGSERGGGGTPDPEALVLDEDEEEVDAEGDGLIDDDLAAALGRAMAGNSSDEGDEEDEDEDESASEDDEDEDEETAQARKLLNEEIRDLEAAVEKKSAEIAGAFNPLIKKRFEDALKKLKADLEGRLAQREQLTERKRAEAEKRARMESGQDAHTEEGDGEVEELDGLFDDFEDDEDGDGEKKGGTEGGAGAAGLSPTRRRVESEGIDTPSTDMMEIG
ncbi:hypothetical protein BOTBODRAFT_29311 [Botryobasidium botryosum FD-172 SS1]|uniref:TAFII55 protein conserved region domain-containing protein n=1 Tax=Botryobasidium botryosum (strain FD-172 SS1) TaxID=930990 RepID=A0A067MTF3_BOTB1|nr:hypothetical protein BOTBODRAFT_29311 [Botryobasidium botryosum FD-172 SS1]